jgi:hypothetical protein
MSLEECYVIESGNDFMIIMMGCGIGYFLMGYLITLCCFQYREKQQEQTLQVLLANQV